MGTTEPTILTYDIRGQICPATLLTALREVNGHAAALRHGQVELVFLTANRDSTHTIPASVENMGFRVDIADEGGYYAIKVSANG